ncbi:MAG TPA: lysine-sensitive aspartokinase 3, partial [Bacteroidetes bacterium]|nr:lysine-sensitive aspartokinase 3 [Bacteroidota bacterium]
MLKILKFGGTSIGSAEAVQRVVDIVKRETRDARAVLVFSAMGKTTDRLLQAGSEAAAGRTEVALRSLDALRSDHLHLAGTFLPDGREIAEVNRLFHRLSQMVESIGVLRDFSPPVQDEFLAHGELLSTRILTGILQKEGLPARWVDSRKVVVTDSRFTRAEPDLPRTRERAADILSPLLSSGVFPVLQGFIAADPSGHTTTLGRGGSDYTAALLGSVLSADEIQIWTDVDGILTADPSLVPDARPIARMSYREAAELAYFGARVLHPKTIAPAMDRNIPVWVRNIFNSRARGTCILPEVPPNGAPVKSIAYKEGMTLITIVSTRMFKAHAFLRRVFEVFDRHETAVDLVATTEVSVALAVHQIPRREAVLRELEQFGRVNWQQRMAVVCVVGEAMRGRAGMPEQVFSAVADVPVSMISLGGSEINLSFVCEERVLPGVIRRLHRR